MKRQVSRRICYRRSSAPNCCRRSEETHVARFKIVTTPGPSPGADYSLEMEALAAIDAEIVEVKGGEDELAAAAVDADAIYGKVRPRITARVINAARKLKVVSLASV